MNKVQAAKTIIKLAKVLATDSSNSRTAGAKYTLTDETKRYKGHTLYRVKYADGKLGGWIESEKNLQGNAKVLDDSMVMDHAVVKDKAIVFKNSRVYNNAVISGNALVMSSDVCGKALVSQNAHIKNSYIGHNVRINCDAVVTNDCVLLDNVVVSDKAHISDNSRISDDSRIYGIVKNSEIGGFSCIEGEVINCNLLHHDVEEDECLRGENDRY